MDVLKSLPDKSFDLAIVDPPYGIGVCKNKQGMGRRRGDLKANYEMGDWDNEPPTLEYFIELQRVSKNQIIFGANHFISQIAIDSSCWIVWDKKFSNEVSFAAVELAWTSFNSTAKKFTHLPTNQDSRIHPTQKPVALYRWMLERYAKPGQTILDTHLGSASSAIACHQFGCEILGMEMSEHYFNLAVDRIKRDTQQQHLL